MILALDGKIQSLKELAFIERMLFNLFNPDKFYNDLTDFMAIQVDWETKDYIGYSEAKAIDEFTRQYFSNKIPEANIWLTRAYIFGRVLADYELNPLDNLPKIDLVRDIPSELIETGKRFGLSSAEVRALKFAREKAGINISNTTEETIKQVRKAISGSIQNREGVSGALKRINEVMFKDVGELNRDWVRVAVYETNKAYSDGYISRLPDETWVMGLSMPDACPDCIELIDKKLYQVTKSPGVEYSSLTGEERAAQEKKWENNIWEGKSNYGRSTAKRKRQSTVFTGGKSTFIDREHHEQAMPTIPLHPNCRCRWIKFNPNMQYIDPKSGDVKFIFEDREAHKKFYDEEIMGR